MHKPSSLQLILRRLSSAYRYYYLMKYQAPLIWDQVTSIHRPEPGREPGKWNYQLSIYRRAHKIANGYLQFNTRLKWSAFFYDSGLAEMDIKDRYYYAFAFHTSAPHKIADRMLRDYSKILITKMREHDL